MKNRAHSRGPSVYERPFNIDPSASPATTHEARFGHPRIELTNYHATVLASDIRAPLTP
jgi:hypothetical protein